jgi:uncharacterized protein
VGRTTSPENFTSLINDVSSRIFDKAGKSTLTRLATERQPTVVRLLDNPATLRAAKDDPTGFVEHDSLMVIDEIQLVPELLQPIKVSEVPTGLSTLLSCTIPGSTIHRNCAAATTWSVSSLAAFPEATRRTPRRRTAFFDSYLSTLIERDVLELAGIERQSDCSN